LAATARFPLRWAAGSRHGCLPRPLDPVPVVHDLAHASVLNNGSGGTAKDRLVLFRCALVEIEGGLDTEDAGEGDANTLRADLTFKLGDPVQ